MTIGDRPPAKIVRVDRIGFDMDKGSEAIGQVAEFINIDLVDDLIPQNFTTTRLGEKHPLSDRPATDGSGLWLQPAYVWRMVPRGGIEPPTLRFSVACSTN